MAYRVVYLRPPGTAASPSIGLITLEAKCAGARSAGNPHAACDVAGAGNGVTAIPKRARRWKRRTQPRSCLRVTAPALDPTAVWHYYRFCLSFHDVEDLLAKCGIIVSYETIRQWCLKFGPEYARKLTRRQDRLGDSWFLDEVFVTINGERQHLWRAVDRNGDVIKISPSHDGTVVQPSAFFENC